MPGPTASRSRVKAQYSGTPSESSKFGTMLGHVQETQLNWHRPVDLAYVLHLLRPKNPPIHFVGSLPFRSIGVFYAEGRQAAVLDKSPVSYVIDHNAFAFDEADGARDFDDALEYVAQKVVVAEVAATVLRETGVVRHGVIKIKPAEPPIDSIQQDRFASLAFGPDAIAVADDCIRRSSSRPIERRPVWL